MSMAHPICDVVIVGGGPAGSSCGGFCAASGLRTMLVEREKFPREKVCGDCLNPQCWPIIRRLQLEDRVRALPHGVLDRVEFVSLRGRKLCVELPRGGNAEIAVKRSLFDGLLLERARELGAEVHDGATVTTLEKSGCGWKLMTREGDEIRATVLVAADGRNSTVARLMNLLPRVAKERIALQAHIPLPRQFGNRIVLEWLPGGYSGQAPTNDHELNLCLVGRPGFVGTLQDWAKKQFGLSADQAWRSITPLTRTALSPAHDNLLLVGDAARVVEPFTGEGIFYAMRSGEIAAAAAAKLIREKSSRAAREYVRLHAAMYRGRLWINVLARLAVVSPQTGSAFFEIARFHPGLLRLLTRKIVNL
jgi:geranylgeranyl reductase family protein